jgi:hypothetical protein
MSRNDDELRISDEDARFVRTLDALYRPPAPTAAERTRFAARLEERFARGRGRRPWLLGGAAATLTAAAAALVLALLPQSEPGGQPTGEAGYAAAEELPSAEEALLLLANGPLQDPNEALPEDYQMLASLLE